MCAYARNSRNLHECNAQMHTRMTHLRPFGSVEVSWCCVRSQAWSEPKSRARAIEKDTVEGFSWKLPDELPCLCMCMRVRAPARAWLVVHKCACACAFFYTWSCVWRDKCTSVNIFVVCAPHPGPFRRWSRSCGLRSGRIECG